MSGDGGVGEPAADPMNVARVGVRLGGIGLAPDEGDGFHRQGHDPAGHFLVTNQ